MQSFQALCIVCFLWRLIAKSVSGDTKEALREKARWYFIKTVEVGANSPGHMVEKMISLFSHKNSNVGIEAQKVILGTLE